MKSFTTERFRKLYRELPETVRRQAREAYKQFQIDPHYPSLQFKRVHPVKPIYSARISRDYRVLGTLTDEEIVWFWIGSHSDYDRLLSHF